MSSATPLLPLNEPARVDDAIERAAVLIRSGGLVAFPTETVYGLGANALDGAAVQRIFTAKGRPAHDPIIVHVAEVEQLHNVARVDEPLRATVDALTMRFWPGALTLVLPKRDAIPSVVTAGGPTVAVRAPRHPIAQALLRAAERPIAAPSANRFSHTSPTTAQHVLADLNGRIDLILDGGRTPIGVESTVLDLSQFDLNQGAPTILRPGGVTAAMIEACLGVAPRQRVEHASEHEAPAEALPGPGMIERHYAPRTTLHLYTGADEAVHRALREAAEVLIERGERPALLLAREDLTPLADLAARLPHVDIGSLLQPEAIAHNLFYALRALDASNATRLLARDVPAAGIGDAVRDRLRRASSVVHEV